MARTGIPATLRREPSGRYVLVGSSRAGRPRELPVNPSDLADEILRRAVQGPLDVVYDTHGGQPVNVRLPSASPPEQVAVEARQRVARVAPVAAEAPQPAAGSFHHPYAFIPVVPARPGGEDLPAPADELADRPPLDHDRYHTGAWMGSLRVRLVVETPLLLLDAAAAHGGSHRVTPVRALAGGSPHLAPTNVKGMLRSAYEAITNSRFGVFQGHDRRLAFRQDAREAKDVRPVVVQNGEIRFVEVARLHRYAKREVRPGVWRRERRQEPLC